MAGRKIEVHRHGRRGGFTLVELLITISIIGLLLAILLPAFKSVHDEAKAFVCMDNMRTVSFDFRLFADPYASEFRGDSEKISPRFSARDFIQSQYHVAEFWRDDPVPFHREPYRRGDTSMICSAVPVELWRETGTNPAVDGSVTPLEKISYAMNRRLLHAPVKGPFGKTTLEISIGERILDQSNTPLMFDADPLTIDPIYRDPAADWPLFSAPAGTTPGPYDNQSRFWFPAKRHRGRMTIAFVGGHVVTTHDPFSDATWDWDYHPPIRP